MIITLDWTTFHSKFFMTNNIYIKENEDFYEFYTYDGVLIIYSKYKKSTNNEENIIFIERFLTNQDNLIRFIDIQNSIEREEDTFIINLENDLDKQITDTGTGSKDL